MRGKHQAQAATARAKAESELVRQLTSKLADAESTIRSLRHELQRRPDGTETVALAAELAAAKSAAANAISAAAQDRIARELAESRLALVARDLQENVLDGGGASYDAYVIIAELGLGGGSSRTLRRLTSRKANWAEMARKSHGGTAVIDA
jgi:hypothetical protein